MNTNRHAACIMVLPEYYYNNLRNAYSIWKRFKTYSAYLASYSHHFVTVIRCIFRIIQSIIKIFVPMA